MIKIEYLGTYKTIGDTGAGGSLIRMACKESILKQMKRILKSTTDPVKLNALDRILYIIGQFENQEDFTLWLTQLENCANFSYDDLENANEITKKMSTLGSEHRSAWLSSLASMKGLSAIKDAQKVSKTVSILDHACQIDSEETLDDLMLTFERETVRKTPDYARYASVVKASASKVVSTIEDALMLSDNIIVDTNGIFVNNFGYIAFNSEENYKAFISDYLAMCTVPMTAPHRHHYCVVPITLNNCLSFVVNTRDIQLFKCLVHQTVTYFKISPESLLVNDNPETTDYEFVLLSLKDTYQNNVCKIVEFMGHLKSKCPAVHPYVQFHQVVRDGQDKGFIRLIVTGYGHLVQNYSENSQRLNLVRMDLPQMAMKMSNLFVRTPAINPLRNTSKLRLASSEEKTVLNSLEVALKAYIEEHPPTLKMSASSYYDEAKEALKEHNIHHNMISSELEKQNYKKIRKAAGIFWIQNKS